MTKENKKDASVTLLVTYWAMKPMRLDLYMIYIKLTHIYPDSQKHLYAEWNVYTPSTMSPYIYTECKVRLFSLPLWFCWFDRKQWMISCSRFSWVLILTNFLIPQSGCNLQPVAVQPISKTTLALYSLYSLLQKTTARYLVIQSCTENTKKNLAY